MVIIIQLLFRILPIIIGNILIFVSSYSAFVITFITMNFPALITWTITIITYISITEITISERFTLPIRFAAAAALVIMSILLFYPDGRRQEIVQEPFAIEEIEQVKKDVSLALGYLAYCYEKTGNTIWKKVIPNYLIKPIKSSMKHALKEIINGG